MESFEIGVVCGRCDTYAAMGTGACPSCGNSLALFQPGQPRRETSPKQAVVSISKATHAEVMASPAALFDQPLRRRSPALGTRSPSNSSARAVAGAPAVSSSKQAPALPPNLSLEELMDQAKNFVCRSCSTPVPDGAQVLRSVRRGGSAGDLERADAVLRAAPDARAGRSSFSSAARASRGSATSSTPSSTSSGATGSSSSRTIRSSPRSTRTSSTATASSSCATRARSTASSCACAAPSTFAGRPVPRRRAALPARRHAEGERRPRAGRHVLLLVAQAPEPLPHHADPPGRRARHDRVRARAACRSGARAAT